MKKHRWTQYHPGIRLHAIPVEDNLGGWIFTLGLVVVFLVGVPIAKWFLLASLAGGVATFLLLRRLHRSD